MSTLPTIYTIQASDAPRHAGKLKEILQNLKSENRITSYNMVNSEVNLSSLTDRIQEEDLILIVLTRQLESQKEQIVSNLKELRITVGVRIGEIIVDNVPYENEFISFPADLKPIRDCENMDVVWTGIEQSLKDLFPVHEPEQEQFGWLRGVLEWPWETPKRRHGVLLFGFSGVVFTAAAQFINYFNDRRDLSLLETVGFSILVAGPLYAIAGAISQMKKASLFFASSFAIGVMVLWIIFFGTYADVIGAALVAGGPVSAIVGSAVGRSRIPFRLAGLVFLGLWPFLFTEIMPFGVDGAFLINPIIIAVVLCLPAWKKKDDSVRAVKFGILPFILNLAGGYLIYATASGRFLEGSALVLTMITAVAAASLGIVYRIGKRQNIEDA